MARRQHPVLQDAGPDSGAARKVAVGGEAVTMPDAAARAEQQARDQARARAEAR